MRADRNPIEHLNSTRCVVSALKCDDSGAGHLLTIYAAEGQRATATRTAATREANGSHATEARKEMVQGCGSREDNWAEIERNECSAGRLRLGKER